MATNEGVGKKIVEALKKQSSNDFEQNLEINEADNGAEVYGISDTELSDSQIKENLFDESSQEIEGIPPYDEKFEIKEQPAFGDSFTQEPQITEPDTQVTDAQPQGWNFEEKQEFKPIFQEPQAYESSKAKQFDMPPNVSVLKKLIMQLPTGVTKQTGAQIIKQTMEALGISMNSVLHDAQKVQDEMNESIKNCMLSIQEYKNNIKNLEKQGLDYQRQVNQLNDLISLFILSDKD